MGNILRLVNDQATPGVSRFYGTDGTGTRGWFLISSASTTSVTGTAGQVLVNGTSGSAATGAVTLTLATAIVSVNSITSESGQNLVLALGTGGTALTLATSTLAATFAGDLTVSGGNVGVGSSSNSAYAVLVASSAGSFSGTTQYGIASLATFSSAATTEGIAGYFETKTTAASFTMTSGYGVYVAAPTVGAASAITTQRGLYVLNQGASGVTNAYGIDIAAQSGAATTNVGLRNAGTSMLTGNVAVGGSLDSSVALRISSTALSSTTQYGIASVCPFNSSATSGGTAGYFRVLTAAASFTMTSAYALFAEAPSIGAGSSITTNVGLAVSNQGASGVTNAYGIDISAQSGAATTNIGLRNAGTTALTNTTASTTSTSGALTVSGGVGVAGALCVGGNASIGRNINTGIALAIGAAVDYSSGQQQGISAVQTWASASLTTSGINYDSYFSLTGSSTVPIVKGYQQNGGNITATAIITDFYAFHHTAWPAVGGGGAVTNAYAFRSDGAAESNKWAFYSAGARSYFGGAVTQAAGQGWGATSTATAGGTTTLSVSSSASSTVVQRFTGTNTQSVQLPAANALGSNIGIVYVIINASTNSLFILRAGSDTIEGGTSYTLTTGNRIVLVSDGSSTWSIV